MLKKLSVFSIVLTLLAGFYFFPPFSASADDDGGGKFQRLLQAVNLPAERHGLQVRLDRGQLVYGLPTDIPDNDWKPAPTSQAGKYPAFLIFRGNFRKGEIKKANSGTKTSVCLSNNV